MFKKRVKEGKIILFLIWVTAYVIKEIFAHLQLFERNFAIFRSDPVEGGTESVQGIDMGPTLHLSVVCCCSCS